MKSLWARAIRIGVTLIATGLILAVWEAWVRIRDVKEYLVPTPSAVFSALANDPERFIDAGFISLQAAFMGLLLASTGAFLIATAMAHSRVLERTLYPPALALKVTPIVAVAPLFTIWFGFGLVPKILITAMITFFPMLVNSVTGLRSIDPNAYDFFRSLDASRWQIFWRLRVPSSLPFVFAGLRISVPLA
ncbi:MAG: ABC transporter permease subunit, partial [Dehalococcoidia bacterium]